ncbi:MAG: hypothetical protein EZS28_022920 [Streblomastix strix]|uniref:Uncharacterized protein n=1 Tax=Streblomastix strix TaxID=222440 RepID=A0A5J4VGA2_9EUKA|nr:MAG: hypothetical protein EZS28_022920 [Streblomastix strix]
MIVGIFTKTKAPFQKIGHGLSCVNDRTVKPQLLPTANSLAPALGPVDGMITKGINLVSSTIDAFGGKESKLKVKDKFNDFLNDTYVQQNLPVEQLTIQVQGLNTIEAQLESNAVTSFKKRWRTSLFNQRDQTRITDASVFVQFDDSYKDGVVLFVGLKSGSNIIREYTVYHRGRTIDGSLQNDETTESFIYNTIEPKSEENNRKHIHSLYENIHKFDASACGTYITMREIEEAIGQQANVPYLMPIRFRVSVPLDNLLIFSAFTDNSNGMFGDLEMKFKINLNAFVFTQFNSTESLAKYYTMKKDELMNSDQQKLMDIDLFFRIWSSSFMYTNQFTQFGCTAYQITSIKSEKLNTSGLKNLIWDIAPVTVSIKNYVVTEEIAKMASNKAIYACINRV